eukprot:scaffold79425_cov55-Phaeocystis_antarctica.AAC.1
MATVQVLCVASHSDAHASPLVHRLATIRHTSAALVHRSYHLSPPTHRPAAAHASSTPHHLSVVRLGC